LVAFPDSVVRFCCPYALVIQMHNSVLAALAVFALVIAGGCREKQPYPGAEQIRQNLVNEMKTARLPDVRQDEPSDPETVKPMLALALIHTAKGTTIVLGREDGAGLSWSQLPGHAWLTADGSLRVARPEIRPARQVTRKKRSMMAGLVMEEYRQDSPPSRPIDLVPELTAGWKETDSFIVDAVQADPEMAGEYYHVESMKFVGSSGRFAAFSFVAESYLGGAHPVESRRLIVVDMEAGRVVDPLPMFGDRDLVREVLKDRFEAACVRKPSGVGFLEGSGGKPVPVLLLTADFGVCEGQWALHPVDPPEGFGDVSQPAFEIRGHDLIRIGRQPVATGVIDFRASPDGRRVVMEMAMGTMDEKSVPWSRKGSSRERTREIRFLMDKMDRESVICRLPEVLSVQFPADSAAAEALARIVAAMNLSR